MPEWGDKDRTPEGKTTPPKKPTQKKNLGIANNNSRSLNGIRKQVKEENKETKEDGNSVEDHSVDESKSQPNGYNCSLM